MMSSSNLFDLGLILLYFNIRLEAFLDARFIIIIPLFWIFVNYFHLLEILFLFTFQLIFLIINLLIQLIIFHIMILSFILFIIPM